MSNLFASNSVGPWGQNRTVPNVTTQGNLGTEDLSTQEDFINLREEFEGIIDRHGHWVFVRKTTGLRCPNYNRAYRDDHARDCPYCMGTGYQYRDYLMKTYNRPSAVIESQAGEQRQDIGLMSHNVQIYYLPAECRDSDSGSMVRFRPSPADHIVEIDLDHDTNEPIQSYRFQALFNIQIVHPARDRKGRVEYYICKTTERPTGA